MTINFKDYFSEGSQQYSLYRPSYPKELFSYLASITAAHECVWDCATGNGQAANQLTDYFKQVIATDASDQQIENAINKTVIRYFVSAAEKTPLHDASVDLITVAQAVHWFDLDKFSKEVQRVLKADARLAVWTYGLLTIDDDLNKVIEYLYLDLLDRYWPAERKIISNAYRDIQFPMPEMTCPSFEMKTEWDLSQLIGYFMTWSAVRNYQSDKGCNPVESLFTDFSNAWGDVKLKKTILWPLILKLWSKT